MFRQTLGRCARSANSLAVATALPQTRLTLRQITPQSALPALRSNTNLNRYAYSSRLYSTESTAEAVIDTKDAATDGVASETNSFKDLADLGVHPNLLDSIVFGMKYETMTPVQAKTISPALKGTDIVAQAKTGTGKTLAFLLPLLNRMLSEDPTLATRSAAYRARSDDIRGIILSPTRELAEQIAVEARRLVRNTGLVVQCAVGGTSKGAMLRQTQRQGCHLLVATPGRLNDLLQDTSSGIDAPNLAALVLDEADRMLDVGFEKELNEIIRALPSPEEKVRQTMLVSATIPDDVIRLARTMVRADDFEFVQTIPENESLTHDKVPQNVVPVSSWNNIFPTLFELMDREAAKSAQDPSSPPFKAIVYFNTTALVELGGEVAYSRKKEGLTNIPAFTISSKLTQVQRSRAADMFRSIKSGVLISSDVTARGMDFPNVTHVIQVDAPRAREDYIHRLGRTGRQDKAGEGWLLLPPQSIASARRMLNGLPIKQNKTLESAEAEAQAEELPTLHEQFKEMLKRVPRGMLVSAYTSLFGVAARKDELAKDLHHWATTGWGWPNPPAVSPKWASQMSISPAYLNIEERRHDFLRNDRNDRNDRFSGGNGRGSRDRFGGRGDAFDAMSRGVRRDDDRGDRRSGRDRGGDRGGRW